MLAPSPRKEALATLGSGPGRFQEASGRPQRLTPGRPDGKSRADWVHGLEPGVERTHGAPGNEPCVDGAPAGDYAPLRGPR